MAAQELTRHRDIFLAIEPQDYDWQIAADSMSPKPRLGQLIQRQHVWPGPQRRIFVQNSTGQSLKQMCIVGINMQMSHLDLCARPGQTRFPLEDIRVAIFFR